MAQSQSTRLQVEPVRTIGFAAVAPAYMGVGVAMTKPIRMILLQNFLDAACMLSFDGINDHIPMPPNAYLVLDLAANRTREQGFYLAEGQRLYARQLGAVPTSGGVYFTAFYGAD